MSFDHLAKIFSNVEFDPVLLILIANTFNEQVINNPQFNNEDEQAFMNALFLLITTRTSGFDFVVEFLGDKDRELLKSIVESLKLVDTEMLRKSLLI